MGNKQARPPSNSSSNIKLEAAAPQHQTLVNEGSSIRQDSTCPSSLTNNTSTLPSTSEASMGPCIEASQGPSSLSPSLHQNVAPGTEASSLVGHNASPASPLALSDPGCDQSPFAITEIEPILVTLDPALIRYSRTRFNRSFATSLLRNRVDPAAAHNFESYSEVLKAAKPELLLESLLFKLQRSHITIDSIDPIRVFFYNTSWYSLDNRRLWVFKQFGKPIPVRITSSLDDFLSVFQEDGDNLTATFFPEHVDTTELRTRNIHAQKDDLVDHIFQWSICDIMDDKLMKSKITMIPDRFGSLKEYFTSYKWPLVEEVRAQIKQSLELIEEAPYAPIVHIQENIAGEMSSAVKHLKKYKDLTVHIDQEHLNKWNQKNGEKFKFKPKDLILLSSKVPASTEELIMCSREIHMMALVKYITEEDGEEMDKSVSESLELPLQILVHEGKCNAAYQELMEKGRTWYAVYLLGLAPSSRIWNAIHRSNPEDSNLSIIQEILNYHPDQVSLKQDDTPSGQLFKQSVANYCSSFKLNKSQTNAVVEVLCDVANRVDPGVRMIRGPPGTGKTSTIVTLVSVASSMRMKCLVVCPTNTAIAEVALRYIERLQSPDSLQFGEFCKSTSCCNMDTNPAYKLSHTRDIVLVGTEDKLPLEGPLKQIYLPYRVKRIKMAYKSWRETVFNLSDFIVSIKDHYQQKRGVNSTEHESLLEFARKKLEELIEHLGKHGHTLVQELPIASDGVFSKTVQLAEKLLKSVLDPSVSHGAFSNWFETNQSRQELVDQLQTCLKQYSGPFSIRESIESLCVKGSSLVFCTVSTAGSYNVKEAAPFQCLVIDEAAQVVEAETALAACLPGLNHAILVGDHQQLPGTVISKIASGAAFGRSLFERMISLGHPCHLLNTQYRMHPAISLFPNSQFYGGRLLNGENVRSPLYRVHEQLLYGSYAFIDVNEGAEQMGDDGKSKRNLVEASVIVALIRTLREAIMKTNTSSLSVGVITPYSSQKDHLKKCFEKQKHEPLLVDINSVDGFQGQERDIIILSTVRANKQGAIGFLKDYRRLNVAITRARYCLWIVGSRRTLSAEHNIWTSLLQDAANRKMFTRAGDEPKLANAVIKAKKDLNQYFDLVEMGSSLFSNMLWKVFFSNDFKQSLLQIKSSEERQKIVYKVRYLASGYHSTRTEVRNVPSMDRTKGLVVVHRIADLYLVWSIDIERDDKVKQIIKIWNLVSFSNLSKLIKRLEAAFDVYSVEYIERCKMRWLGRDDKLTVPVTWEEDSDFVWFKTHVGTDQTCESHEQIFEISTVNESLLLMKFYAMSSGIAEHLLTAENGSEFNLPFEVNKEESIIIRHPSSCFILGRSGTGKTTVLVTKLLQREQQYQISLHGLQSSRLPPGASGVAKKEHIKQILITLSPLLCSAIKQQITQIQRTVSAVTDSTSAYVSSNSDYELFLDDEDENRIMGFLPNTFVEMPGKYYPMVLTFRRFLLMLNNSLPGPFSGDSTRSSIRKKEVDFEQFDSEYWPHLNSNLTRKFDSCTVFTEIMSVIKGSIQAVKAPRGVLSKESYLSSTSGKMLNIQQREDIYDLFLQYEKTKIETQGYDLADYVQHVYKQLSCGKYQGDKIDFVYIDEVQDFTQAQISLFSFVCNNSKEGYFLAGDTAQTIARGVNFRFQDVRSLFYTDFQNSSLARKCGVETAAGSTSTEFIPELFQLKHNFRTHVGVVNMANSIVQLLYYFFPQSIDKLYPETSLVWGQLPISLTANGQDLVKSMFESSGDAGNQVYGLGAQQVILVRDETQKTQLVQRIGKKGLVLTINGCKGLEFQDVLVYNFFSGSLMQNKWRVIYQYMNQHDLMSTDNTVKKSHPTFDANKHNLLCSELKHLYVAVTRARQRLWIYEENADLFKPMLDYWVCQELIEAKCVDESFISSMASNSTTDDWKKRGFEVFNQQQYDMAILCFERAGDDHHAKLAKAANLQQVGEKQISKNKKIAINNLKEAAELFLTLERAETAAKCHIKIGDLYSAGVIYRENCTPPRFEAAGDCFSEVKSWNEAAKAYFEGTCVKKCLAACLIGKQFEKGLLFIRQWRERPEPGNTGMAKAEKMPKTEVQDIDEYLQKCAAHFHKQCSIPTMMMFVAAFSVIDKKRTFLKGRDYIDELLSIEEAEQNYLQAAELAELKGDFLHVVELLEKAGDYDNAVKKVLLLIRRNVLWGAKNKGWPFRKNAKPVELLWKVQEFAALAKSSVCCEAEVEARLMLEEVKSFQEWKDLPTQVQTSSNTAIKLFSTWKSMDASLKDLDHMKGQKLDPVTKFHDKNTLLVITLRTWTEWRDMVMHCRQGLPGNNQDNVITEFCYDFFGVTHTEDIKSCLVHDPEAYWFKGYRKGRSPMRISVQAFSTLATQFWDEQLSDTDERMTSSLIMHFSTQCGLLKDFKCINVEEKTNLLLDLTDIAGQLTANMQHSKELQALTSNLQAQLLVLLWPQYRCAHEVCNIQKLREATRVVAVLDKVADKLTSNCKEPCTLETTARMQLIFPFLSEAWITENASSFLENIEFWKNDATWSNSFLQRNSKLSVREYVEEFGNQLVMIFHLDWRSIREYISPLVFVALLEKTTVMACACDTQRHELLLPLTLAVDFMCGKGQEGLYQKILKSKEQTNEKLCQLIEEIVVIIFQLLREPRDIVDWFKHVKANEKMDLPPMVSRLFTVLYIICLNSRKPQLKASVVTELQKIFRNSLPILQHLQQSYKVECRRACHLISETKAGINQSMKHLQHAFAKTLSSMGDTLLMTRCENQSRWEPQDGVTVVELDSETDIFMKLATVVGHRVSSDSFETGGKENQVKTEPLLAQDHATKAKESYNAYLSSEARFLMVSTKAFLDELDHAIASLKYEKDDRADLLTELNKAKEELQHQSHQLDPSHEMHTMHDLEWLKARVNEVQIFLIEKMQNFEYLKGGLLKVNLLEARNDGNADTQKEVVVVGSSKTVNTADQASSDMAADDNDDEAQDEEILTNNIIASNAPTNQAGFSRNKKKNSRRKPRRKR